MYVHHCEQQKENAENADLHGWGAWDNIMASKCTQRTEGCKKKIW